MENLEENIKDRVQIGEKIGEGLTCLGEGASLEVVDWRKESPDHQRIYDEVTTGDFLWERHAFYESVDAESDLKRFRHARSRRFLIRWTVSVAASVVFLCFIGYCWKQILVNPSAVNPLASLSPEVTKPILMVEGKESFLLSDSSFGLVQNGVVVENTGKGELSYVNREKEREKGATMKENRLIVPRGNVFSLVLEDGTRVWINAGSELIYPVPFSGNAREVQLRGEAYFEVAKDVARPFRVKAGNFAVQVTGTAFDVSSYEGDEVMDVTLVHGGVMIMSGGQELATLQPLQCFTMNVQTFVHEVRPANLQVALAWRENLFVFKNETLNSIVRQLSRWYDVEFVVDDGVGQQIYSGTIARDEPIEHVFDILRLTNEIEIMVTQDKKIEVIPKQ